MERVSTSGNQTDFWQGEHDQIRTTLTRSGHCANCAMRTAARRREFNSREARALLLEHSDEGHFTDARLKAFLVSYPVRKAHKECLKVTAVLKATARQLQATHQLSVETPTRFAPGPQNAQEVELLLHGYVEGLLAADKLATAKKLRNRFQTLHWNAGGWPADLTNAINSCLLEFSMRDRLAPTKNRGMLSLFSGGQSDHSPANLVGLKPRCLAR